MAVEIRVPQLGESIVEATIIRWLKHEGDIVAKGDLIVELETDKISLEVPSEQSGVLEHISRQEGETVGVNEVIGTISDSAASVVAATNGSEKAEPAAADDAHHKSMATPLAQRIAAEAGIDLSQVKGSGAGGKVVKEDLVEAAKLPAPAPKPVAPAPQAVVAAPPVATRPAPPPATIPSTTPAPTSVNGRIEERVRMSRRRQTIAVRLVEAQHTAAMLTTFNEVDMTAVMDVRKRRKDSFKEKHGVGLGFMSFFTKASIAALKAFPRLNAEIQGDEMVVKKYYDIGIAVGVEEGLVVPVVRDADRKSFAEIEREIGVLAGKARENKLALSDLQGGTFTITNGGVFGSLMSTPILNAPQVGILGMHKIQERPMVVNGEIVIRPMMYLALSYDHRIVDGGEAVRFLVKIKELLEDPEALLLEG